MRTKPFICYLALFVSVIGCSGSNVGVQVGEILERLEETEERLKEAQERLEEARDEVHAKARENNVLKTQVVSLNSSNRKLNNELSQQNRINQDLSSKGKSGSDTEKDNATVAKIINGESYHGVLIPGEIDDTFLYAEWDREDDSFWLEIRDERPGTVWHIDGETYGLPSIDTTVTTAAMSDGVGFRRTEEHQHPYLYMDVERFFLSHLNQKYMDILICSTEEHLRFNTDQPAVETALLRYFNPAVKAKEKLLAKEEKRLKDGEGLDGYWVSDTFTMDLYKDGTAQLSGPKIDVLGGKLRWSVDLAAKEFYLYGDDRNVSPNFCVLHITKRTTLSGGFKTTRATIEGELGNNSISVSADVSAEVVSAEVK